MVLASPQSWAALLWLLALCLQWGRHLSLPVSLLVNFQGSDRGSLSTCPRATYISPCQIRPQGLQLILSIQFSHSVVCDSLQTHGWQHARPPCPSPTPEFTQTHVTESVMPSNHLILCCPLLLLPSIFPSIRVFSNELAICIRWPKYWSFSISVSPSNEYSD